MNRRSTLFPNLLAVVCTALLAACGGGGGGGGVDVRPAIDYYNAVVIDDLDGDGALDLVLGFDAVGSSSSGDTDSNVVLFRQHPGQPGRFPKREHYSARHKVFSVAIGDFNADGLADIAVTQSTADSVARWLQDAGTPGEFLPPKQIPATNSPLALVVNDLDGDGLDDIAVAGKQISMLFNDPADPGSSFSKQLIDIDARSIDSADLDSDGRNDLVVTSGDRVIVLLQDPLPQSPGKFSASKAYAARGEPRGIAIADLDGDSLPDLAVADRGKDPGYVLVYIQNPLTPGRFFAAVEYTTSKKPLNVAIGDLNNDLLPDLAVAGEHGGKTEGVSVLLQDPSSAGVFLPADVYRGVLGPRDVAIADLNGDGFSDLAVADSNDDLGPIPYIRFQNPNQPGNFLQPVSLPN